MRDKIFHTIIFLPLLLTIYGCTNYAALGLPRGINGHIMRIVPGQTSYAYMQSMYGKPANIEEFPDGSKNISWVLDTSEGDCLVESGFTPNGIVNWYNYIYKNAIKFRK